MKEFINHDSMRILVTAVILNYPMLASLGDGLLLLLMFWAGRVVFGHPAWFHHSGLRGYLLMVGTGMVTIISLEMDYDF